MRSPRKLIIERIRARAAEGTRYRDIAARVCVWRRGASGEAERGEVHPVVHGGRYDQWQRRYAGAPERIAEIACHPGQARLLLHEGPEIITVLLGAPGGGKTFAAVAAAALKCCDHPNATGGVVAPTEGRLEIVWKDFLGLVGPLGWIAPDGVRLGAREIRLVNNTLVQFVAAKRPSGALGSPIQGYSWEWAIVDEMQNVEEDAWHEIRYRGRRVGLRYRIVCTATNQALPVFQHRLELLRNLSHEDPPVARILPFRGEENVFTSTANWELHRKFHSAADYERIVNASETEFTGLVYPSFSSTESLREVPLVGHDVTEELTGQVFGQGRRGWKLIVGHDFGAASSVSVVLRAFREPHSREVLWWAVDEVMTQGSSSTGAHVQALLRKYRAADLCVIGDPHGDRNHNDRVDYMQFRNAGVSIFPASGVTIANKHRFAMVNALLASAELPPRRRLFVASDGGKVSPLRRLVESLKFYQLKDVKHKGRDDISHATDALGYGLFPFEKIRGQLAASLTDHTVTSPAQRSPLRDARTTKPPWA